MGGMIGISFGKNLRVFFGENSIFAQFVRIYIDFGLYFENH
jgi:hypothetical protein